MRQTLLRWLMPYGVLAVCVLPLVALAAIAWGQVVGSWFATEPDADAAQELIASTGTLAKTRAAAENDRAVRVQLATTAATKPSEVVATNGADLKTLHLWNTMATLRRVGDEFPPIRTPESWDEDDERLKRFLRESTFAALDAADRDVGARVKSSVQSFQGTQAGEAQKWEYRKRDLIATELQLKNADTALDAKQFSDADKALSDARKLSVDLRSPDRQAIDARIERLQKRIEFNREAARPSPDLAKIVVGYKSHRGTFTEAEAAEFAKLEKKYEQQQQALLLKAFPRNGTAIEVAAFVRGLPLGGFHESVKDALRVEVTKWFETSVPDFPEADGWSIKLNSGHTRELEEVTCKATRDGKEQTSLYVGAFELDPDTAKSDPKEYRYYTRLADLRNQGGHKKVLVLYAVRPSGDRDAMTDRPRRWRAFEWREVYLAARKLAIESPGVAEHWKNLATCCIGLERASKEYAEATGDDAVRPTGSKQTFVFDFAKPAAFAPTVLTGEVWPALREVFEPRSGALNRRP